MKTIAEIEVIPLGEGVSMREEVMHARRILEESGLHPQVHALGTEVEGDMEKVLVAVKAIHEQLHACGATRLATQIKLSTRLDKDVSLEPEVVAK